MTSHSSQGQTADRVLIHVDTEQGERSSSIAAWHTLRCRVAATMRISIRTIKPLLPKGLAAMFHTDLHWSRQAHQDLRAPKGPSRPLPWLRRDSEQSNEISALAARHATRSCGEGVVIVLGRGAVELKSCLEPAFLLHIPNGECLRVRTMSVAQVR